MACGAFYAASETLARPGSRCFRHYPLSTFNYSLAKLYLAFVSVARFGGGRGIRRLAARGWASLLIGADLPKGRALARSLFTRRARRSRPQEAAALGTINYQFTTTNYQLSTFNFQLFICHALPCFIAIARFGGGNDLFASMMAFGTFYAVGETLARPGSRAGLAFYAVGGVGAWVATCCRGWASLLIGADLPKGRALARSLFTRRARRSRAQDAAALGTINYQFTTTNYQLSTFNFQLSTFNYSLAKLYLAFVSVARFGGGRGIRRLAARGWASLLIGADLAKG